MNLLMKILLPVILLIVVLLGGLGYLAYSRTAESLENALIDEMDAERDALLRALHDYWARSQRDLEMTATSSFVTHFYEKGTDNQENIEHTNKALQEMVAIYPFFDRFALLDKQGVVVSSSLKEIIGTDYSKEPFFTEPLSGKSFITPPFKSPITGRAIMMLGAPTHDDNGQLSGVIVGVLSMVDFYKNYIAPVKIGERGYAYLLGADAQVLAHKDPSVIFNPNIANFSIYQNMVKQGKGNATFVNYTGLLQRSEYISDPDSGMTVVIQAEEQDVFSGLYSLRRIIMASVGIAILLGGVVTYLIMRPIVRDLKLGALFAGQVAEGNLDGTLNVRRGDEIGRLANALRTIPEALRHMMKEYTAIERKIEAGELSAQADASLFKGEFANLIEGTNAIINRFRNLLDEMSSPVVVLNKDLRATYINKAAESLAGSDYHGKTCAELFAFADSDAPDNALQRALRSESVQKAETKAHADGQELDVAYTAIPFHSQEGKLSTLLVLVTDLTSIKETQRTIIEVARHALDISNRVATAAEQLSAQVEQISRGTDIQRDRVTSTATAMEEMNSTVLEVARNASEASESTEACHSKAAEGADLVKKVITSIQQVDTITQDINVNMEQLNGQAEAIGSVMDMISDIADQTNLLALNAAIEAARAGEAGRGFAVVADEVRKLAEKTMLATNEVGDSIKGIQTSATANRERVILAAQVTSQANELATVSGNALQEIVDLTNTNAGLVTGIATAAEEQSSTSDEINHAIEDINRIASETAEGMNQSADAVGDLARLAQELREQLSRLQA